MGVGFILKHKWPTRNHSLKVNEHPMSQKWHPWLLRGSWVLPHSMLGCWLAWLCAGKHSCWELKMAIVLSDQKPLFLPSPPRPPTCNLLTSPPLLCDGPQSTDVMRLTFLKKAHSWITSLGQQRLMSEINNLDKGWRKGQIGWMQWCGNF